MKKRNGSATAIQPASEVGDKKLFPGESGLVQQPVQIVARSAITIQP